MADSPLFTGIKIGDMQLAHRIAMGPSTSFLSALILSTVLIGSRLTFLGRSRGLLTTISC